ncbi:MAG: SH3 domain-containing protein [Rhizobiaceae bacterium]
MRGSQGLKPADAARNAPPLQHSALQAWQSLSDRKAGEKQLLNFPQREVFRPAPQPAVGATQASPQRYPTLAANDAAKPRRRGRYNWDGRYVGQAAADEPEGPSLGRRVLLPAGALALLAGVALGAFYLMHTFAAGPDAAVANAAAPAKTETAVAQAPVAAAEGPKANADAPQGAAERVAAPAAPVKAAAVAPKGVSAKVPAPDNARWGDAEGAKVAAAPQPQAEQTDTAPAGDADATPKVNDPQSAPVPTEEPKMAVSKTEAPKTEAAEPEAPKKLAYASPSQAVHPVDKAVTAALPSAESSPQNSSPADSSEETTLPGVNANPLSVPAKASADEADNTPGGYVSTVHTDVKLHASASNGSRSIGVVPRKASVHVLSCSSWCKISYNGKEGYVFKSFLGRASAPAPAQPEKTAAAPAVAPVAPVAQAAQSAAKPAAPAPADAKALEAASERTRVGR